MSNRGAARRGIDVAGGVIAAGSPNVFTNNCKQARIGDAVTPHGKGIHRSPVMATGSPTVITNGIPTSRLGDVATCGHPTTGSGDVFIGDQPFPVFAVIEPGVYLVGDATVYDNTEPAQAKASAAEEVASPGMSAEPAPGPPIAPVPEPVGCDKFPEIITTAELSLPVSKYFTLGHCKGVPVAQRGLTAKQICCNWASLCTAILDQVYEVHKFTITSGWRPVSGGKGNTDHGLGLAADIQITGSVEQTIAMFKWIVASGLPFTQVIYERSGASGVGWTHVSYKTAPRGQARTMWTYNAPNGPFNHGGQNGQNLPPLLA